MKMSKNTQEGVYIYIFRPFVVVVLVLKVLHMVSLCSFGACPGTHSVDQSILKLTEIYLTLPTK